MFKSHLGYAESFSSSWTVKQNPAPHPPKNSSNNKQYQKAGQEKQKLEIREKFLECVLKNLTTNTKWKNFFKNKSYQMDRKK